MGLEEIVPAAVGFDVVGTGACVHGLKVDVVLADHDHNILRAVDRLNRKATGEIAVARAIKLDEFSDDSRAR